MGVHGDHGRSLAFSRGLPSRPIFWDKYLPVTPTLVSLASRHICGAFTEQQHTVFSILPRCIIVSSQEVSRCAFCVASFDALHQPLV